MAVHLVTGGSGFVGSHIAEYLLERGEEVRILDLDPPDVPGTSLRERTAYVEGDVRDPAVVRTAMDGAEYVHHTVALVPLTKAGSEFRDVNVGGTRTVMQVATDVDVEGVSHISSSAVYDLAEMPVTESTPVDPIGRYGQSKLEADRVVLGFADDGLPVNVLRPRTVVDTRRAGIYQILFDWMDHDKRIFMLGDGENEFQLVSARDLADASFRAVTTDVSGEIFNIGNKRYSTLGDDLRHLIEYSGSDSTIRWIPARPAALTLRALDTLHLSPLAPWHYQTVYRAYYFDISKATELLEWEPTDSNVEMLERAYDWYRTHDIESGSDRTSVHRTAPKQRILSLLRQLS